MTTSTHPLDTLDEELREMLALEGTGLDVVRLAKAIKQSMAEPGYGYIDIDYHASDEELTFEAERLATEYAALSKEQDDKRAATLRHAIEVVSAAVDVEYHRTHPGEEPRSDWPSLDDFRRMSPAQVNAFLASRGLDWRVVEPREEGRVLADRYPTIKPRDFGQQIAAKGGLPRDLKERIDAIEGDYGNAEYPGIRGRYVR